MYKKFKAVMECFTIPQFPRSNEHTIADFMTNVIKQEDMSAFKDYQMIILDHYIYLDQQGLEHYLKYFEMEIEHLKQLRNSLKALRKGFIKELMMPEESSTVEFEFKTMIVQISVLSPF